jgi:hypothetical protein
MLTLLLTCLAVLVLAVWALAVFCYRQGVVSGYGYRRDPSDERYSRAGAYLYASRRGRWPELRVCRGLK